MEPVVEPVVQNSISELWKYHNPRAEYNPELVFTSGFVLTADVAKAEATTFDKIMFIVDRAPWRTVLAWACWCAERAGLRERHAGTEPHTLSWEVVRWSRRVAVGHLEITPNRMVCALARIQEPSHFEVSAYHVGAALIWGVNGHIGAVHRTLRVAVREAAEIAREDADWMVDATAREAEHVVQLTRLVEMVEVVNAASL